MTATLPEDTRTEPAPRRPAPTLAASVLPADFARLGDEVRALEAAGVERVQWDVMDGVFVPNLTVGPDVIAATRPLVSTGFEAHLMVADPDPLLARWVEAGCERVIVHAEACRHLHRTVTAIEDLGALPGVALNPGTPLAAVEHVLDRLDLLLVMTVDPGFGGQRYLPAMESKIRTAAAEIAARELDVDIEVDGGIDVTTVGRAAAAGASILVAGTALFRGEGTVASRAVALRAAARGAA